MTILKNLHSDFQIDASEPAASQGDIDGLRNSIDVPIPEDYLSVVREMTEVEILVKKTGLDTGISASGHPRGVWK